MASVQWQVEGQSPPAGGVLNVLPFVAGDGTVDLLLDVNGWFD